MTGEWPCMPFAPKTVHKRINVFDIRMAVEFIREHFIQFSEGGLVSGKIVARHLEAFRIIPIFRLPFALERDVWYFIKQKRWHSRVGIIGVFQHYAKRYALPVFFGNRKGLFPSFGKLELACLALNVAPVEADVDLLNERNLD